MNRKTATYAPIGMQKDLSTSRFDSKFAFDNKNIRIVNNGELNMLSLVNERGTSQLSVTWNTVGTQFLGIPLGYAVISHKLIVFTHTSTTDYIYCFWFDGSQFKGKILKSGNFNFQTSNPIETLTFYESEKVQKVYWTDGLNPLRFINVVDSDTANYMIDFVTEYDRTAVLEVAKLYEGTGEFSAGTVQYYATYYNQYGQETTPFAVSPMYYVSPETRGAGPEEVVTCSFKITISKLDTDFDKLRIYSVHKNAEGGNLSAYIVADMDIPTEVTGTKTVINYGSVEDKVNQSEFVFDVPAGTWYIYFKDGSKTLLKNAPYNFTSSSCTIDLTKVDSFVRESSSNVHVLEITDIDSSTPMMTVVRTANESGPEAYTYTLKCGPTGATFNYVRKSNITYSTVEVRKDSVCYVDTGKNNVPIDPSLIAYLGGNEVKALTMTQKDNTLFLGNVSLGDTVLTSAEVTALKNYFSTLRGTDGTIPSTSTKAGFRSIKKETTEFPSGIYQFDSKLSESSYDVLTFKGGEFYRFAMQFQNAKGQWSQAFWIGDCECTKYPLMCRPTETRKGYNEYQRFVFSDMEGLKAVLPSKIKACRILRAKTTSADRSVIAQGIINPTVFNFGQRKENSPFSIASWYMRPDNSEDYDNEHLMSIGDDEIDIKQTLTDARLKISTSSASADTITKINIKVKHKARFTGVFEYHDYVEVTYYHESTILEPVDKSASDEDYSSGLRVYLEHRNAFDAVMDFILNSLKTRMSDKDAKYRNNLLKDKFNYTIYTDHFPKRKVFSSAQIFTADIIVGDSITDSYIYDTQYFIDRSILTFNTPDFDIMQDRINKDVSFRIVGHSAVSSSGIKHSITVDNISDEATDNHSPNLKDYSLPYSSSKIGSKRLPLWTDIEWSNPGGAGHYMNNGSLGTYAIYPWHKSGSISGHPDIVYKQGTTVGAEDIVVENNIKTSILKTKKFANLKVCASTRYFNQKIYARTTVDGISSSYDLSLSEVEVSAGDSIEFIKLGSTSKLYQGNYDFLVVPDSLEGAGYAGGIIWQREGNTFVNGTYHPGLEGPGKADGVRIKYKSTPHIVMSLAKNTSGTTVILPNDEDTSNATGVMPWDTEGSVAFYDKLKEDSTWFPNRPKSYFWIGEFYIPHTSDWKSSWLGGYDTKAIESLEWIPSGETTVINDDTVSVSGVEGDSYFQRWDCLKTYPYTEEDENSVIDITSLFIESYRNLDGRYDRNRGVDNLLYCRPENMLYNDSYTQDDDILRYSALSDKYNVTNYPSQVIWSLTKTPLEDVDTWTSITGASSLDFDGDKGKISKLERLGDSLVCFQDEGVSEIMFNNLTALTTTAGVPLEIANSGKVTGKRYLSTSVGCVNKWSVCPTTSAIYFIDGVFKKIYRISSEGLMCLSDSLGFSSWCNDHIDSSIWNPATYAGFLTQYSQLTDDVYFINKDIALAYNEKLQQFSSFYSYGNTYFLPELDSMDLAMRYASSGSSIHSMHTGNYNMYFGVYDTFHTEIVANPDPLNTKIFDILEFQSDSWSADGTLKSTSSLDCLEALTEYQEGHSNLSFQHMRVTNLKRKFRIWRAYIPRTSSIGRGYNIDKMRNYWVRLKLGSHTTNTDKTIIHSMSVHYFI